MNEPKDKNNLLKLFKQLDKKIILEQNIIICEQQKKQNFKKNENEIMHMFYKPRHVKNKIKK